MEKENEIVQLSFRFALEIVAYCEKLEEEKKFVIANQLLRSGTSIGANIREAQNAESMIDFLHRMKIAAKEADESEYWLLICNHFTHYPSPAALLESNMSVKKVLNKIISSTKKRISSSSKH